MNDREIKNARIRSTMLGREDHGILTFMIDLEYGGGGQGFGGYGLDEYDAEHERRVGVAASMDLISEILRKVHGIGNVLDDRLWLYPEKFFAAYGVLP